MAAYGPMQLLVVGFDDNNFRGEILPELRRLREQDVVRLVDLLVVSKDADGSVAIVETSDLTEAEASELGAIAAELIGLGEEPAPAPDATNFHEEVWYIADTIAPGKTAAVAVLEHRWAIPLRDAIERAGGQALADAWLHPSDLLALGSIPDASAPGAG